MSLKKTLTLLSTAAYPFLCCLFLLTGIGASAQNANQEGVNKVLGAINKLTIGFPAEKIYVQLDKPRYAAGDTLWLKAYVFEPAYFRASQKSGLLYVEVVNDSNKVVKRVQLPLLYGTGRGNLTLDAETFSQGGYTLRVYSNWMRNFGQNYVSNTHFEISSVEEQEWLVSTRMLISHQDGRDSARMGLRFTRLDKEPVSLRELQLKVLGGKKTWYKESVETALDGTLNVNFLVPEKTTAENISIQVEDLRKGQGNRKLAFPVISEGNTPLDLQFMPEGGDLVAGIGTRVGFKAIGGDGNGHDVSGRILDSKQQQVAAFSSAHKGMGNFTFTPKTGEIYTASVQPAGGTTQTFQLPPVKTTGTVLRVDNPVAGDSLQVTIHFSPDLQNSDQPFYLVGQSRGVACLGAAVSPARGIAKYTLAKKLFPTGVARFILLNSTFQPLNERMTFIDHHDNLEINLRTQKTYATRDSIAVEFEVTDTDGQPVVANFSLAVTDDTQVKRDSLTENTILSSMHFTSNLKGTVEDPGYYFQPETNGASWQDLDNLLLTQGWVGYSWEDVFHQPKAITYPAEPEFVIRGKVTNLLNKPVAGSGIVILSGKPLMVKDTITDAAGTFAFRELVPSDSTSYLLQARNKKGKSFNVGIEVAEFVPPAFTLPDKRWMPWYLNSDPSLLNFVANNLKTQKEKQKIPGGGVLLNEIGITTKKVIKNSKNLNGAGEADLILDEAEMVKAGKMTLGDLLQQRIKGYHLGSRKGGPLTYMVNDTKLHIIIDGVDIDFANPDGVSPKDHFDTFLDYYSAEDIKGIELMRTGKYQMRYTTEFLNPMDIPWDHTFVEITTRSGHGPFMKKTPGVYLYKPIPFILPDRFYRPRYTAATSIAQGTDRRSTIYWAPDIITTKEGKATVSFYAADLPGSYTLILEGSDMSGHLGSRREVILVKKR